MSSVLPITMRPEVPGDAAAVREILDTAFEGPAEGILVERLRANGDLVLALVALHDEKVTGYVAWPRLWLTTPRDQYKAVALAPLAIAPSHHGAGVGSALTREGLSQLRSMGESIVFALGDPAYYERFGFSLEAASVYESEYAGAHFMALRLTDAAPENGRLSYPAAFDELA
jgi:putative acetyltransferase